MKRGLLIFGVVLVSGLGIGAVAYYFSLSQTASDVGVDDDHTVLDDLREVFDPEDRAPLLMTTMTHMEGGFNDDESEEAFLRHVEQLRYGMSLADEYGAKLTIESERPFAEANEIWDLNIMQEIVDAGHGVGTHCDRGGSRPEVPVEELAKELSINKELVDALVGEEENRGCSGAGGRTDWVLAAAEAGFDYINGIVGFHYLSMDLDARPDGWSDAYIVSTTYHDNAPVDIEDRIYPRMLADATDFDADEDGVVLANTDRKSVV